MIPESVEEEGDKGDRDWGGGGLGLLSGGLPWGWGLGDFNLGLIWGGWSVLCVGVGA